MSELPWLRSLIKHNVAAKHGSSKPLTSNELWLLELQIKSTRILASIPDALWDMCKLSILHIWRDSSKMYKSCQPSVTIQSCLERITWDAKLWKFSEIHLGGHDHSRVYLRGMVKNLALLPGACHSLFSEAGIVAPALCHSYCILIYSQVNSSLFFSKMEWRMFPHSIKFSCLLYPKINAQVINPQN